MDGVVGTQPRAAWLPVTGVIVPFALYIAGLWVLTALVVRRLRAEAERERPDGRRLRPWRI